MQNYILIGLMPIFNLVLFLIFLENYGKVIEDCQKAI